MYDRWEEYWANADNWKDPEQRARDAIATMKKYVSEAFRRVGPEQLLAMRARMVGDPANAVVVEMIDRRLNGADSVWPPE